MIFTYLFFNDDRTPSFRGITKIDNICESKAEKIEKSELFKRVKNSNIVFCCLHDEYGRTLKKRVIKNINKIDLLFFI